MTFEFELLQAALNVSFIVSLLLHRRWVSHLERTVDNLAKAVECHHHSASRNSCIGRDPGHALFKCQEGSPIGLGPDSFTAFIDRVIK
jgi:hypothetical protein